jgi:hypothetical protein
MTSRKLLRQQKVSESTDERLDSTDDDRDSFGMTVPTPLDERPDSFGRRSRIPSDDRSEAGSPAEGLDSTDEGFDSTDERSDAGSPADGFDSTDEGFDSDELGSAARRARFLREDGSDADEHGGETP